MHYHIITNMSGYMPGGDPYVISSKRAAQRAVAHEAREQLSDFRAGLDDNAPREDQPYKWGRASDGMIWVYRDRHDTTIPIACWYQLCADDCDAGEDDE